MEGTVMLNSVFAIIIELRSISNVRGLMVFFKAFILVTLGILYTCQNYFDLFVMPLLSRIGQLCSVQGHTCPKKNINCTQYNNYVLDFMSNSQFCIGNCVSSHVKIFSGSLICVFGIASEYQTNLKSLCLSKLLDRFSGKPMTGFQNL